MPGVDPGAERPLDLLADPTCHPAEVQKQLDRILTSRFFISSKRYSGLLRYLVEQGSSEKADALKERTIGVDVFGRAADYDSNTDHVVRTAVGEIRKRLAQYYLEAEHEGELRIEVPSGSYLPRFRFPVSSRVAVDETSPSPALDVLPTPPAPQKRFKHLTGIIVVTAVVLVVAGVAFALRFAAGDNSVLDRFWGPLTSSSGPILICVGEISSARRNPESGSDPATWSLRDYSRQHASLLAAGDAFAMARLVGTLQPRHQNLRLLSQSETTLDDLRGVPTVIIGIGSNEWSYRLTGKERFSTMRVAPSSFRIVDKENPGRTDWSIDYGSPYLQLTHDYAIVSRIRNPVTEQIVVLVGGLYSYGNIGAAEFLSNPDYLRSLERLAPVRWESKNLEFVLSVDVIKGKSGVPRVVAAHFW